MNPTWVTQAVERDVEKLAKGLARKLERVRGNSESLRLHAHNGVVIDVHFDTAAFEARRTSPALTAPRRSE